MSMLPRCGRCGRLEYSQSRDGIFCSCPDHEMSREQMERERVPLVEVEWLGPTEIAA